MKVEFLDGVWGPELFVNGSDFKTAMKSRSEFDSLANATAAFAHLLRADYRITEEQYEAICSTVNKNGAVIFTVTPAPPIFYPNENLIEVYISNENHIQRAIYMGENGQYVHL